MAREKTIGEQLVDGQHQANALGRDSNRLQKQGHSLQRKSNALQSKSNALQAQQVGLQAMQLARMGEQTALLQRSANSLDEIAEFQKIAAAVSLEQAQLAARRAEEERSRVEQFDSAASALHSYGLALHKVERGLKSASSQDVPRLWLELELLRRRSGWMEPQSVEPAQRGDLTRLHTGMQDAQEDLEALDAGTIRLLEEWLRLTEENNALLFNLERASQRLAAGRRERGDDRPLPGDLSTAKNQLEECLAEVQRWEGLCPQPVGAAAERFLELAQAGSLAKKLPPDDGITNDLAIQRGQEAFAKFAEGGKPRWLVAQYAYPRIERNTVLLLVLSALSMLLLSPLFVVGWVLGEKYFGCVVDMRRFHALCEWQIAAGRAEADALRQLVSEYEALGGWLDAAQKGQRMYQLAGEYQDYSRPLLDASLAG